MLNTAPEKILTQKVNIICAMSSDGDVWIALTTCNTDSNVLMLFMTHLASALTKQAPDWRASTVFLLDGVSVLVISDIFLNRPRTTSRMKAERVTDILA